MATTKYRAILLAAGVGLTGALSFVPHSMAADGSWTGNPTLLRGGYVQEPQRGPQQAVQQQSNLSGAAHLTGPTLQLAPTQPASAQPAPIQLAPIQLSPPQKAALSPPDNRPGNCKSLIEMGIHIAECAPGYYAQPVNTQAQQAAPIMLPIPAPQSAPLVQQQATKAPGVTRNIPPLPLYTDAMPPDQSGSIISQGIGRGGFQPPEINDDGFTADWSVTLRGTFVKTKTTSRFDAAILPQASLTRHGRNGDFTANISAEGSATSTGLYRIDSGTLGFEGTYAIDRATTISGGGGISITQETTDTTTADTTSTVPSITSAPVISAADLRLGINREFGRAFAGISASAFRQAVGPTGLSDGTWTNNDQRNYSGFELGTRVGLALTPRITIFSELTAAREMFDIPNPGLESREDNWTYSGIIGAVGNWDDTIIAEATFGYAHRQFDDPSLTSVGTFLYGGSLALRPNRATELSANLSSTINPSDGTEGATARFTQSASLRAQYLINDWVSTNANLGANWAWYAASPETANGYSAGVGAAFNFNKHISVGLDYGYTWSQSSTDGISDTHRMALSTTFRR